MPLRARICIIGSTYIILPMDLNTERYAKKGHYCLTYVQRRRREPPQGGPLAAHTSAFGESVLLKNARFTVSTKAGSSTTVATFAPREPCAVSASQCLRTLSEWSTFSSTVTA